MSGVPDNVKNGYLVDDKHGVMMGYISKGGSTALKVLLVEANSRQRIPQNKPLAYNVGFVHSKTLLRRINLRFYYEVNETEREVIKRTYFIFMSIRHPLDRLLSTYRGKIVARDTEFGYPAQILRMFNQSAFQKNPDLADSKHPEYIIGPPSFSQFLKWIKKTGRQDRHWNPINAVLHPCSMPWAAIMRLVTMNHDGSLLLDKLRPDVSYNTIPV